MSQTPDSAQVTALPPKDDFAFSVLGSASFAAAASLPHLRAYFRANHIESTYPLHQFAHVNSGLRYRRFKVMTQARRRVDGLFPEPSGNGARMARQDHADYAGSMLGYDS